MPEYLSNLIGGIIVIAIFLIVFLRNLKKSIRKNLELAKTNPEEFTKKHLKEIPDQEKQKKLLKILQEIKEIEKISFGKSSENSHSSIKLLAVQNSGNKQWYILECGLNPKELNLYNIEVLPTENPGITENKSRILYILAPLIIVFIILYFFGFISPAIFNL